MQQSPLEYQTPPKPPKRAALALFVASIVAFFLFFLVVPPLITLVLSLALRKQLVDAGDKVGEGQAAAAFATSVMGAFLAIIVLIAYLNGMIGK